MSIAAICRKHNLAHLTTDITKYVTVAGAPLTPGMEAQFGDVAACLQAVMRERSRAFYKRLGLK